ncbi:hypothetical protein H8R18_02700 [Nanchangia anserum]|uniref:hypothetical protein n=1 Tax=Nanchangia anserum TaxID=2692125 RepID=UPI001883C679|nr:hypothetical protein [Nanchangia anserum]QOX82265.1 hypothetical protein H8R18_02700 [Nanchangia anserum]
MSVLTASSAQLYRRFGFGPATRVRAATIDIREPLTFRHPPRGDVVEIDPEAGVDEHRRLYDAMRLAIPGATTRSHAQFSSPRLDMRSYEKSRPSGASFTCATGRSTALRQ